MVAPVAIALGLSLAAGPSVSPAAPPSKLASYCSPRSGDLCFAINNKAGAVFFDIDLAGPYFSRYQLCVRPPRGSMTCRSFPIRTRKFSRHTRYFSSVRWHTNYAARGPGVYRVTWKSRGRPLGPTLRFRLPLSA
jgi:hypothetical protein